MNEFTTEEWYYMGRRQGRTGLVSAWLNHHNEIAYFKKLKAGVVGGLYSVACTEDGSRIKGDPTYSGGEKHPKAAEWELDDKAAYTEDESRKMENRAARENQFADLTMREVRDKILTAGPRRAAYLAVVLRYIGA